MSTTVQSFVLPVLNADPAVMFGEAEFAYVDIAAVDRGQRKIVTPQVLTPDAAPSRARQVLAAGDVIVSTVRPNLNTVALVPDTLDGAIASTGFCVLRPNQERLDKRFLFHWISSESTVRRLVQQATGATYPAVSDRVIKSQPFSPPGLVEQQRIALILDKADSLRSKRQEAIRLADEFLRATFVDLFGDPVTNSQGWPTQPLESLGTLDRGVSKHRPRNDPSLLGGDYPLIQTGDVANCDGYIRTFTSTYSDKGLRQSKLWPTGTLCITIAANIAKTGILLFPACFPDSVVGFSAADRPTVEYVRFWLSFLQQTLEANAPASAQKNINLAILRELQIPVPPRDRVERFAAAVDKVEAIRKAQRLALDEGQKLNRALEQALLNSLL
ncbi:restriction endonuclease subunit S [Aquabacterium sp. A08]|uniref:restriction endonuclease subunit S n=1 Tax=Aquabacterium sp. A08 TaxID=2718532 RepID=UPI0014213FF9|nr:restriction endonuclease subunit S [Aquabacterium sp. A08]NIC42650.1 restriction endonuclease subunit S [Aquabacterium sp. A08]